MPGQRHSQSPNLLPALLAEIGVFYVPLRQHGVERTPNKSQHTKLTPEKKILPPLLRDSNSQPLDHKSGALPTNYPGSQTRVAVNFSDKPIYICIKRKPQHSIARSLESGDLNLQKQPVPLGPLHTPSHSDCQRKSGSSFSRQAHKEKKQTPSC